MQVLTLNFARVASYYIILIRVLRRIIGIKKTILTVLTDIILLSYFVLGTCSAIET